MEKMYGVNTSKKEVELLNLMQKQVYRLLFDACKTVETEQHSTINELLHRPWHEVPKTSAEIDVERKENAALLKMQPDISEIPINPNKVVSEQPNKDIDYVKITGWLHVNTDGFALNWFFNGGNDKLVLIEALSKDIITDTAEVMQNKDSLTDNNFKYWLLRNYSNENCSTFNSLDAFVEILGDQWQELLKDSFVSFFRRFFLYLSQVWKKDSTPPKHINIDLPKIDETKYNAKWIFDKYNNVVFKCTEMCFNSWLKDGIQHPETIEFILKGRQGKPAIAQLRKFIEKITGDAKNTKDTYYKTVFGLEIKTAHLKTATNLNDTFKELKNYKLPNKPAK